MESGTRVAAKAEHESQATHEAGARSAGAKKVIMIDLVLRVLLLASAIAAVVLMRTSKQTELIRNPFTRNMETRSAEYDHSPAFIYFVAALSLALSYSATTIIQILLMLRKPCSNSKLAFYHGIYDALMLGIVASATGTAGAVAYIGLKGNKYVGWMKVCSVYDKFCKHVASSVALALIASVLLLALVMLSMCTAHKRQQARC